MNVSPRAEGRLQSAAVPGMVPGAPGLAGNPMFHRLVLLLGTALASVVIGAGSASAHPHVWVTMHSELVYAPDGTVTGVRHVWAFDDMFSTFATQGLESKKKNEF